MSGSRENERRPLLTGGWVLPWRIRLPVYATAFIVSFGVLSIFIKDGLALPFSVLPTIIATWLVEQRWLSRQRSSPSHDDGS